MKLRSKQVFVFTFICLFFVQGVFAQQTNQKQPLIEVFNQIESQHDVQFNYDPNLIKNLSVLPPNSEWALQETINYLQEQTGLTLKLQQSFILVSQEPISLCGYIKELDSDIPLADATIQTESSATVSNEDGYFELTLKSRMELFTIRFLFVCILIS